jgi:hypothetical protein
MKEELKLKDEDLEDQTVEDTAHSIKEMMQRAKDDFDIDPSESFVFSRD